MKSHRLYIKFHGFSQVQRRTDRPTPCTTLLHLAVCSRVLVLDSNMNSSIDYVQENLALVGFPVAAFL